MTESRRRSPGSTATLARCGRTLPQNSRARERDIGVLPRLLEAFAHRVGLWLLALRLERLRQSKERPTGLRVLAKVLPENGFRFIRPPCLEKHRSQRLPNGCVPISRFLIDQAILEAHRALEMEQRAVPLLTL